MNIRRVRGARRKRANTRKGRVMSNTEKRWIGLYDKDNNYLFDVVLTDEGQKHYDEGGYIKPEHISCMIDVRGICSADFS
jgi:hypothetical protein